MFLAPHGISESATCRAVGRHTLSSPSSSSSSWSEQQLKAPHESLLIFFALRSVGPPHCAQFYQRETAIRYWLPRRRQCGRNSLQWAPDFEAFPWPAVDKRESLARGMRVASSSSAASEGVKERRWEEREPLLLQQDEEARDVEGAGGGGGGKKKAPPPQLPPINPLRVRAFFVAAVLTVFTSSLVPSITSRVSI